MRFYLRNDIPGRLGTWYVCWTDDAGRGYRSSARTRDYGVAQKALARFILEHDIPRDERPEFVTIEAVMVRYWHHHGRTRFAKDPIKYALKHVSEKLPKITVAEFDRARQLRFMRELADEGQKPGTTERYMGVIEAALNRAKDLGELVSVPDVLKPDAVETEGVAPFTVEEIGKLFAASRTDAEKIMMLLWTGTCCRPGAVLDLTWDRVDFVSNSIDFRVPGRRIVKKRRTLPPMAPTLAAYLHARRSVGFVVPRVTKKKVAQRKGFRTLMRRLAERAGVAGTAYGIRKGVATYLRADGVPEADVLGMLGHRFGGSETERYARPGYMAAARDSVEKLLREVAPPWLPVASNWRVPAVNPLFSQVAANDQ